MSTREQSQTNAVLALACLAQFMVVLDVSIVNVALPKIGRELHYSQTGLQWVVNAYVLTFAGFLLLGGRAVDLFGRRTVFLAGLGLFSVASLLGNRLHHEVRAVAGIGERAQEDGAATDGLQEMRRLRHETSDWLVAGCQGCEHGGMMPPRPGGAGRPAQLPGARRGPRPGFGEGQQLVAQDSASPPGYSTPSKPVLIHTLAFGPVFDSSSSLASGARGIVYYSYFAYPVGNYRDAAIDQFGHATPTWDNIQNVNLQIQNLAPTLLQLTSDDVYHFGKVPSGCHGADANSLVTAMDGDFGVGDFTHADGTRYVMIVNENLLTSAPCHPQFRHAPKSVKLISPYTGNAEPLEGEQTWLAPGTGVLLKVE